MRSWMFVCVASSMCILNILRVGGEGMARFLIDGKKQYCQPNDWLLPLSSEPSDAMRSTPLKPGQ